MEDYNEKSLELMSAIRTELAKNNLAEERFNNFEKSVESRLSALEIKASEYEVFISQTTGFFTRAGFYLDGIVLYLKMKFGKK